MYMSIRDGVNVIVCVPVSTCECEQVYVRVYVIVCRSVSLCVDV